MTIHSTLCLGQINSNQQHTNAKSVASLQAMWIGTNWAIIDKQSMVSCKLFMDISSALSIAKDNTEPFGGINLVCARDFNFLWDFNQLVNLQQYVVKKKTPKLPTMVEYWDSGYTHQTVQTKRGGQPTIDFTLLNTQLIKNHNAKILTNEHWSTIPIIVSDNATKD